MPVSITLEPKAVIAGKETAAVTLHLEKLTGKDLIAAEEERDAMRSGSTSGILYGLCLAARAAGCPVDDLMALPARQVNRIAAEALDFLAGAAGGVPES